MEVMLIRQRMCPRLQSLLKRRDSPYVTPSTGKAAMMEGRYDGRPSCRLKGLFLPALHKMGWNDYGW